MGDFFVSIVLDTLPAAQVCHTYFQSFLESVHPIIPVCHIPTLEQKYSTFRQNLKADSSIESLALMLAVLYTGGANSNPNHTELAAPFLTLYDTIFGSLDFASYQTRNASSSTQLLQAYIIMHTFQASYLAPFSAYGFLPLAIRFAQSLRLHTQPKNWGVVELEVGRRIWWHLVFTDIESTIATGLPPIIYPSSYTTELPSLYHDPTLDSKSTVAFSPMMVAVRGHFQWAHRMQIWFESLPSKDEVSGFKNLIETLVNSLPNIPANEWPRTYLKMQIDRAYCMLGLRFWQLDQYKGTGCQSEVVKYVQPLRTVCLTNLFGLHRTARSFLNHYLALSRMTTYGNFTWFIPHLVQPLHATIILLMHISTCSDLLVEEALSRPLLDTIFRTRVDRILSARIRSTKLRFKDDIRANPRYLILVELRKRVWKKVGWEYDGKGVDPWGGRTIEGVDNVAGVQSDAARLPSDHAIEDNKAAEMVLDQIPHIWSSTDSTGLEGLDNLLASDPMDLFQWDEWESLAADFFTN